MPRNIVHYKMVKMPKFYVTKFYHNMFLKILSWKMHNLLTAFNSWDRFAIAEFTGLAVLHFFLPLH